MTNIIRKPIVYVRAASYDSFRNARSLIPGNVRQHICLRYVDKPLDLRGVRHPMVWRFDDWDQHPQAEDLNAVEESAISTRWSWPPAEAAPLKSSADAHALFAQASAAVIIERDRLRAENVIEWESGRSFTTAELLRRAIRGIRVRKGRPLWPAVMNLCGVGSNVSHHICRWAGRDPDTGRDIAACANAEGRKEVKCEQS